MIETHHLVVNFGKHKGELWTRVPVNYLRWLVNNGLENNSENENIKIALSELTRRGTVLTDALELSPHALDKASLRCRKIWHQTALDENEGLYSWLYRVANLALVGNTFKGIKELKVEYINIRFVFKVGEYYPVLLTVMPSKRKHSKVELTEV